MNLEVTMEYTYGAEITEEEKEKIVEAINRDYGKNLKRVFDDMFLADDGRKQDCNFRFEWKIRPQSIMEKDNGK